MGKLTKTTAQIEDALSKAETSYQKPASGIPAEDLDPDVFLQGPKGDKGDTGTNGVTFTPSVDTAGNLSWTNNGGLANPATVNIKGPKGDTGSSGSGGATSAYPVVEHGTSSTTFALTPNTFHRWGQVTSLALTLGTEQSGVMNEYVAEFASGATPCTLSLPATVSWGGDPLVPEAYKMCHLSIVDKLAVGVQGWMLEEFTIKDTATGKIYGPFQYSKGMDGAAFQGSELNPGNFYIQTGSLSITPGGSSGTYPFVNAGTILQPTQYTINSNASAEPL